jgi:WD40 repeat protein
VSIRSILCSVASFVLFIGSLNLNAQGYSKESYDSLVLKVRELESAELVQSMSLRSLITPFYLTDLKGLIAKQAYDFWMENDAEKYVSHLNIYSALYYANKYLDYDSVFQISYNEKHGHNESVTAIKYLNQNPQIFYSAGTDGKVIKWNAENLDELQEVVFDEPLLIESIDIDDKDQWLLVQTKKRGVVMINIAGSGVRERPFFTDKEPVQAAIFSSQAGKYIVATKDGSIKMKSFSGDKVIGMSNASINTMVATENDEMLLTGSREGVFEVWEDTISREFFYDEMYGINAMALSSDEKLLLIGREKGDALLWNMEKMELIRIISGHQSAITDVDFSADGKSMLTASRDKTVRIWDVKDSKKLPLILDDHDDWVLTASFDPNGKYVISGSKDRKIRIWPIEPQELADRICENVTRNLTLSEWNDFVGENIPYRRTCPLIIERP